MRITAYILGLVLLYFIISDLRTPMDYGEMRTQALKNDNLTEFKVGVVWPFSTNNDLFLEGIQLAVEEINSIGVLGRKMRLVIKDTASNKNKARSAADGFIRTKDMLAVIGHYDSSIAAETSIGYEKAKLLFLDTGAFGAFLSGHDFEYFVRTSVNTKMIAEKMVKTLAEQGYKRIYIVTQEDEYGQDLAFHFKYYMDLYDMDICRNSSYFRWEYDFHEIIHDMKSEDCDLVFLTGYEPWAGYFIRDMRDMGVTLPYAAAFTAVDKMRGIAGNALDDSMYFTYYDPYSDDPENEVFVRKFRQKYGVKPDAYAATAYDTLHMLADSIRTTGSFEPLNLSYFLRYIEMYNGVNGFYRFSPNGEVLERPFYLMQVKGDREIILNELKPEYNRSLN
ncbi:ABC transporter substrate-binding protein [Limisalsivibrio acetivorans]|uniref:ABC transporter substrate-binding protein n=1 Tax=Limisalsivibrio acetivorans TaxID=1304888 RepID=UPI0003B4B00C|nr:ABC transporter substrate-binding protein [Limisalsivibrio acetivorans]